MVVEEDRIWKHAGELTFNPRTHKPSSTSFIHFILFPPFLSLRPTVMASQSELESIIERLEAVVPENLTRLDAFPKLPSTYKTRTDSRGFLTLFVSLLAFLLILNDIGEYVWGWPDYEFSIDDENAYTMDINVDMVVNMPCGCQSKHSLPPYFQHEHSNSEQI
jgi:hypothetical protein